MGWGQGGEGSRRPGGVKVGRTGEVEVGRGQGEEVQSPFQREV